jgi:hypothetical protein
VANEWSLHSPRLCRAFRFDEADAEFGACGFGEAFQGAGGGHGASAFEAGDDGLCGAHLFCHVFLRHAGLSASADERIGERKLLLQCLIFGDKFGVFAPFEEGFFDGNEFADRLTSLSTNTTFQFI